MRCLNCKHDRVALNEIVCPHCGVHLESVQGHVLKPQTPLREGRYIIEYALGQGGFGITYRAVRADTGKRVAIKEFYPSEFAYRDKATGSVGCLKAEGFGRSEESFRKEAEMLAKVRHPGIVEVYDVFSERGTSYIVMEFLPGHTLSAETFPLPEDEIRRIMTRLTEALAEAHRNNIVHLDIKPDNIMRTEDGRIVLIDFGAARQVTATTMKTTRSVAYTAGYAPMELESGNRDLIGPWSDIYELGALLHEMLTGHLPPPSADRVMSKKKWTPALGKPWQGMCDAALAIHPDDRPQTVQGWWGALAEYDRAQAAKAEIERQRERERHEIAEWEAVPKVSTVPQSAVSASPAPASAGNSEWAAKSLGGLGGLLIGGGIGGIALGMSAPAINSTRNWLILASILAGVWVVNTIARKARKWVSERVEDSDYALRSFGFASANLLRFVSWCAVLLVLSRGYTLWSTPQPIVKPPQFRVAGATPAAAGSLRPRSVWLDTARQAILYIDKPVAPTKNGADKVIGVFYAEDTEYHVATQIRPGPGGTRIPVTLTSTRSPKKSAAYSGVILPDRIDLYRNGVARPVYSLRSAFANGQALSVSPLTRDRKSLGGSWSGFIGNSGPAKLTLDGIGGDGVLSGVITTLGERRRIGVRGAAFPFGDRVVVVLEETAILEGGNWTLGMNVGFLDEDGLLAGKGGDGSEKLYEWEFDRQ